MHPIPSNLGPKNSEKVKPPKNKEHQKDQAKVGEVAQEKLGFFRRAMLGAGKTLYGKQIDKAENDARTAILGRVPGLGEKLDGKLPPELKKIIPFLHEKKIPCDDELMTSLIWIVLGNLAIQVVHEDEKITTSEFIDRSARHLLNYFGNHFNKLDIDHPDGNIPKKKFVEISNELFAQLIPIEGKILNHFKPRASMGVASAYENMKALMMGQPIHGTLNLGPIQELVQSVDGYVLKALVNTSLERDEIKLAGMTGQTVEQTRAWAERIAQAVYPMVGDKLTALTEKYLPEDSQPLLQRSIQAAVTKLCMNAAEKISLQNPDQPCTVEGLLQIVQQDLQAAFASPNPADVVNFSRKLIGLLLPQDVPYVGDFAKRYEERYMPLVNETLSGIFAYAKAQPLVLEDARRRVAGKIKDHAPFVSLIDQWYEKAFSGLWDKTEKTVRKNALGNAGLTLLSGFEAQGKTTVKALTWKILGKLIPDPAPGEKWESSEVFTKILERFQEFASDELRPVTEALKEKMSNAERLKRATELSLPLMRNFIRSFVTNDLMNEIPLPEKYRLWAVEKLENLLTESIAGELIKATNRSLEHPKEPEIADAVLAIMNLTKAAHVQIKEGKAGIFAKIDDAVPLINFMQKQVEALSVKGVEAIMALGKADQFSKDQLKWMGAIGKPLEPFIQGWIWKAFNKMIPQPVNGKALTLAETFPKIFEGFEKFADVQFPGFLKEARKQGLTPEKLNQLSKPVFKAFIKQFVSGNFAAELPVPTIYQEQVSEIVEDQLLGLMNDAIMRFIKQPEKEEPSLLPIYGKYKHFLPSELKNSLDPIMGGNVKYPVIVEQAKAALKAKVDDVEQINGLVDALSEKIASIGTEKGLQLMSKKFLSAASRPLLNPFQKPMEIWVRGFIWKVFVRLIPNPPADKKFQSHELLPRILDNLVQFSNDHFPAMMDSIRKDWKHLNREDRKKKAVQLTGPLLQEFLKKFVSADLEKEIPLPASLRKMVKDQVDQVLNDYLADALVASSGWLVEQEDNEAALNQLFGPKDNPDGKPSAPVKACHAAGKLIEAVLPYQCREKHDAWAQMAFNAIKNWLPQGDQGQNAASSGKKLVDSFLKYVGNANSPEVQKLLSFMSNYAESALLKIVRQLGTRIQKLDDALVEGDPSTMENAMKVFMQELEPHLRIYGKNRKQLGEGPQKMREAFKREGQLHQAMEDDQSRAAVFQTWSAKFLAMAGIVSGENLPVPALFKDVAWEKLQVSLLPALLVLIFDKLKDPQMLDQLLRIGLEKISADWNKDKGAADRLRDIREMFWPKATADYRPKEPVIRLFEDPYQHEMEEKIGRLGHLLARMESSPVIGKILARKKVRKLIGQVVGQPLRGNFRDASPNPSAPGKAVGLNEVLGASFDAFVNHFMPCEKVNGKWVYFTHNENGEINPIGHAQPDFVELCPKTPQEKEEVHIKDLQRRAKLKREVAKGTARVIKDQVNLKLQSVANPIWDTLVEGFVKFMRAISRSKHKNSVEMVVRKMFWALRRYVLFPILALFTLPIWLPVRLLVNTILAKKGQQQIDVLKKDIHLNLAYRVVDEILHKLEKDMHVKAPVV